MPRVSKIFFLWKLNAVDILGTHCLWAFVNVTTKVVVVSLSWPKNSVKHFAMWRVTLLRFKYLMVYVPKYEIAEAFRSLCIEKFQILCLSVKCFSKFRWKFSKGTWRRFAWNHFHLGHCWFITIYLRITKKKMH